jgi:hypothetical protein
VVAGLMACAVTAPAAPAAGAAGTPRDAVRGLPQGVAQASLDPEPSLPVPRGWPFPDAFSRTSGTGRLSGGAFEWTDWVYDDYGAASTASVPLNSITESADALAPAQGEDVYPNGASDDDGADIFRAAVGLAKKATICGSTGTRSRTGRFRSPNGPSTPTTTPAPAPPTGPRTRTSPRPESRKRSSSRRRAPS